MQCLGIVQLVDRLSTGTGFERIQWSFHKHRNMMEHAWSWIIWTMLNLSICQGTGWAVGPVGPVGRRRGGKPWIEKGLKLKLAQVTRATRLMMAHVFNGIKMHSCEMLWVSCKAEAVSLVEARFHSLSLKEGFALIWAGWLCVANCCPRRKNSKGFKQISKGLVLRVNKHQQTTYIFRSSNDMNHRALAPKASAGPGTAI